MTLAALPAPTFTGPELSTRLNSVLTETRAARRFPSVAALLADSSLAYGGGRAAAAGDRVETADGFSYEVAASTATDHHVATAGGVRLYALRGAGGALNLLALGASNAGANAAATTAALLKAAEIGGRWFVPAGRYRVTQKITFTLEGTLIEGPAAGWDKGDPAGGVVLIPDGLGADYAVEFSNPNRAAMRSIGMRNVAIDLHEASCGGLKVASA